MLGVRFGRPPHKIRYTRYHSVTCEQDRRECLPAFVLTVSMPLIDSARMGGQFRAVARIFRTHDHLLMEFRSRVDGRWTRKPNSGDLKALLCGSEGSCIDGYRFRQNESEMPRYLGSTTWHPISNILQP